MSEGGSGSGGSGFDWGLRPGGGSEEPAPEPVVPESVVPEPVVPEPVVPDPVPEVTQLLTAVEPVHIETTPAEAPPATDIFAADSTPPADPDSAIDALFGETQFREYEPGVLDPNERPFAARAGTGDAGSPGDPAGPLGVSRNQKVLLSVVGGLVAVLALVALFFVGTRLPGLFAHKPVVLSSPSASPTPTSTAKPVGPIANGVHPWTALLGGECLDPYTNPWAEKFTVVDCAKPHPAQMVFRGTFDTKVDPSYPGVDKLQAQISLLCAAPGVINLAAAGTYTDAQVQGSYPVDQEQWAEGEHDYFCFVSRASGQPLTGSVAVPQAAPATPAP